MNQYNGFTPRAAAALEGAQRAAQQAGHTYIGSEHLLLALLREGAGAAYTLLFQRRVTAGKTERALLQMVGRGHPTLLESEETTVHYRAAVEEALREAQMGGFLQAGTEHLLLALCGQQDSGAVRLMNKLAVDIPNLTIALRETIRLEQCEQNNDRQIPKVVGKAQRQTRSVMLDRFGRELTELARQGRLDPVIGREQETERLLQILSRRSKNNPCLIGEAGVGKTAVVEGVDHLTGAPIQACDLRAGAALVIAALAAQGTSEISCVQYIERGYENLVEKLRALGADIRAVEVPGENDALEAHIG